MIASNDLDFQNVNPQRRSMENKCLGHARGDGHEDGDNLADVRRDKVAA